MHSTNIKKRNCVIQSDCILLVEKGFCWYDETLPLGISPNLVTTVQSNVVDHSCKNWGFWRACNVLKYGDSFFATSSVVQCWPNSLNAASSFFASSFENRLMHNYILQRSYLYAGPSRWHMPCLEYTAQVYNVFNCLIIKYIHYKRKQKTLQVLYQLAYIPAALMFLIHLEA